MRDADVFHSLHTVSWHLWPSNISHGHNMAIVRSYMIEFGLAASVTISSILPRAPNFQGGARRLQSRHRGTRTDHGDAWWNTTVGPQGVSIAGWWEPQPFFCSPAIQHFDGVKNHGSSDEHVFHKDGTYTVEMLVQSEMVGKGPFSSVWNVLRTVWQRESLVWNRSRTPNWKSGEKHWETVDFTERSGWNKTLEKTPLRAEFSWGFWSPNFTT